MSKIEWTEQTWNPIVGCTKVSPGCKNCYAEKMAKRLKAMNASQYQSVVNKNGWTGEISFVETAINKPLWRKKPTTYFVNSMSDMFHKNVTPDMLKRIWSVMEQTPQHTYQILTKRAMRMNEIVGSGLLPVLQNAWLGVSAEDQETANARLPFLRDTPAAVRFVSFEPLLGAIDISRFGRLDWVIVGGESGPGARPVNPEWVRSLRDQCVAAHTPFFFKQWGEYAPVFNSYTTPTGYDMVKIGKKNAGKMLDGKIWDETPICDTPCHTEGVTLENTAPRARTHVHGTK